ncbi:universal stress protein [Paenarthrobacter sp. NPDC090522]|uniref:universal stress protein n=1 Tax=Paenarthrobacter sp. NPDC090522 TaxID=3364383 RepID=UPI00380AD685
MTDTPPRPLRAMNVMRGPVIAGVAPKQQSIVVEHAAALATAAGLPLVCAFVDVTVYPVDGTTGGPMAPIDPDGVDEDAEPIPASLEATIAEQLAGSGVDWSLVALAGEPAHALARLAGEIGASLIVVGSREHKMGSTIREMTGGSVARQLLHRQDGPVLVVPVDPRVPGER